MKEVRLENYILYICIYRTHSGKAKTIVVICGCESWTIKKADHQRTDAFKLWCWRRLLRVPWTAKRSNQSIIKEINPEYSLEELMLMQRADSLEKTLRLGKIEGRRKRGWQRMRWLRMASSTHWTWVWANSGREWRTGKPSMLLSMGSRWVGHNWATGQQQQ